MGSRSPQKYLEMPVFLRSELEPIPHLQEVKQSDPNSLQRLAPALVPPCGRSCLIHRLTTTLFDRSRQECVKEVAVRGERDGSSPAP